MESINLFNEIGRIFPQSEAIQVLDALMQDPLVWQSMQQPGFFKICLEGAGNEVPCWSPGYLAFLTLGEIKPDVLRTDPMVPLGHTLQEKALRTYQAVARSGNPPATLTEAGLLALALRERRRLTGTWSGLLQEILPKPAQANALFPVWRTALACLYAYIPDPVEMLRGLMPKSKSRVPFDWVVLAQLAQPLSQEDHSQVFTRILKGLPVNFQLTALRSLSLHGHETMASEISDQLVMGNPAFSNLRAHTQASEVDPANLSSRALSLHQLGTYYQLKGDREEAQSLYSSVEAILQQWLQGLYLQRINLKPSGDHEESAVLMESGQLSQLASGAQWLKNELGVVLVKHPYASSVLDQVSGELDSAFLMIQRAAMIFDQEPTLARDLARQGSQALLDEIHQKGTPFEGEYVYSWRPQDTIEILMHIGLLDEALSLSQALLEVRPVDLNLRHLTAQLQEKLGFIDQALCSEQAVVALAPENPLWRKALANLWGQSGDWKRSYDEWKMVLSQYSSPEISDRLDCARAALQARELDEAVKLSEAILAEDPNYGAALGVMGQALIKRDEPQQAVNCLVRATLLSPDDLSSWLALADLLQEQGESQRSLETLRAAVTALPDVAETHLALGQVCNQMGLQAEALPHLKKAFLLSNGESQAVLKYGGTLRLLGHLSEALAVLERSRPLWAKNPELAYEYARVLLDQDNAEAALPVLETALRNGLPVLDGHLLYAKILLGEYKQKGDLSDPALQASRMQQADLALRRILEISPDNLEARFLRADILREKGDLEEALTAYRELTDLPQAENLDLGWRVQWGMARTASRLNRSDIALAAYREACAARPGDFQLRRGLAETSLLAELPQEALEVANDVLNMAADNVDNLAWYADFAARLGENQKAVDALKLAIQIDPRRPDLLVDLAQWQMSAGDLEEARTTLESVGKIDTYQVNARDNFLRRAAQMYLRMEDLEAARDCFEKALIIEPSPDAGLFFEIARLHERMGNYDQALQMTQSALEVSPDHLPAFLLQADLLGHLERPQAALALLERALKIAQGENANDDDLPEDKKVLVGDIHGRFSRFMLHEGNIADALHHAERALAMQPKCAGLGYQAADLAFSLGQNERGERILAAIMPGEESLPKTLLEQGKDGLNLLCLYIEAALAGDRNSAAGEWIEEGWNLVPYTPRLLAAKVRLMARQGDLAESRKVYEAVIKMMKKDHLPELDQQPVWLSEAALEAQAWNEALTFAENYQAKHSREARAHLFFAKTLVLVAEQQRLCTAAGCTVYAPGVAVLDDAHQEKFNQAISSASKLVNIGEIGRWQARGQAVFTPSAQSARILAAMPANADDVAALVAVLRQLNNRSAAMQVARRYPEDGKVLLQLALSYLGEDSIGGLAVAEKAVQAMPKLALAHAVLARLAGQASAVTRAIEAYGKALEIWPDEAAWHDEVGDLHMQAGKVQQALAHRKKALELVPNQPRFAYKLGQACMARGDTPAAMEYLERSTSLDVRQPDVWLALASAYHMSGRLPQAMEAAKQAGSLDPTSAEGLLIAGETALSMNQIDQALELAQNAVRREPENASAFLFLSNVLVLQGKEEEGLAVLDEAAPSVRQVYPVAFERARLIYKVHGSRAALEVLEKMVKDHPEEPGLLNFISFVEAECGDPIEAEKYAFKSLRLDSNQPDLSLLLGKLQRKSGQLDQAVHLLSDVVRMSPNHLEAYLELASVYHERREFQQALQVYRQAMRVAPSDFQAYYQSGLILRDSKDYSAAETMLRKAAELAPENLSIRRQLVGVIALNLVHNKQEVSIS